ncbi:hypothetical protein PHYSODRAFT_512848 [Phytophthora sojae]|uniref:PiggyBac transposable element-derived protein domain-containing protein n=1 Tax=Phytophthora sojae (strain P6497) TaxID=1094619 RepID=G4ZSU8_PHYSP|nr:hypothetical protein PHYSODRAFT_512848 [Phytophthora sojae]EGZ13033.1 hypothetical protein PHYSODRAFT_512848 [Phytophthora sojae]|eukprot:XP_009530462.1 hypothetical protein PHYSODRAFT_512848 [Phytophthora sojae]
MYPWSTIQSTLQHTNVKLIASRQRAIAEGDFFRFLGVRLAMAVEPRRGSLRAYWEKEVSEGFVGTAANFGERFCISRHTFEQISSALSFADDIPSDDLWKPIRSIVVGYNSRRQDVVSPGDIMCVDECMSAWQGKEGKHCHDGIPHKTKIPRKPEGIGAEIKAIADGDSGILLGLELVEVHSVRSRNHFTRNLVRALLWYSASQSLI